MRVRRRFLIARALLVTPPGRALHLLLGWRGQHQHCPICAWMWREMTRDAASFDDWRPEAGA